MLSKYILKKFVFIICMLHCIVCLKNKYIFKNKRKKERKERKEKKKGKKRKEKKERK